MVAKSLVLQEHLHHPAYHWPHTLLQYPVCFQAGELREEKLGSLTVLEKTENGEKGIPFQLSDVIKADGYVRSVMCGVISDLPSGAGREFVLRSAAVERPSGEGAGGADGVAWNESSRSVDGVVDQGRAGISGADPSSGGVRLVRESGGYRVETEQLQLCLYEGGAAEGNGSLPGMPLFRLCLTDAPDQAGWGCLILNGGEGAGRPDHVSVVCHASGSLFAELELLCTMPEGAEYAVNLRIIAGMPFVEMEERMSGFSGHMEVCRLEIIWEEPVFTSRYSPNRKEEPADLYLRPDGELPFVVLPYRNWNSWWHEKSASFSGNGVTAGLFVRDAAGWDDGAYALWGSLPKLAVRFRYREANNGGEMLHWCYPLENGTRSTAVVLAKETQAGAVEQLRLWYGLLNLDKVKDWVLDWPEPQPSAPGFFRPEESFPSGPAEMERMMLEESQNLNHVHRISPVAGREFFKWVPLFDLSAPDMTEVQFKRARAASAFMAYVHMDENVMPVRRMLAGHPNFLADVVSVPGMMAALFPGHPQGGLWREHFERAMALNLKYHTRPDVEAMESRGGRWTENLGVYVWAAVKPMVRTAALLAGSGDCPVLYPNLAKLAEWLLHALSAPVSGSRTYPPQGAHADYASSHGIPQTLKDLGMLLRRYRPQLAEQLFHAAAPAALAPESGGEDAVWRKLLDGDGPVGPGAAPEWASAKYTGYGYVLRAGAGTPQEASLHLQQLDRGPNYRWGRASDGGNGVLYYFAAGRRWSWNGPEDVGDVNRGDAEACTNFAVVRDRVFRGIGPCALTEPLHDFGFAQYARIVSDAAETQDYLSRSVLMSGSDYAVIYDEVADMRVKGRFSWFVHADDPFPSMWQLKPGASYVEAAVGRPVDWSGSYDAPEAAVKGRYYDGHGDFLTLVSPLSSGMLQARATEYGALVVVGQRREYIFRHQGTVRWEEAGLGFTGRAGIIRVSGDEGDGAGVRVTEAAIFDGSLVKTAAFQVQLISSGGAGRLRRTGFACRAERGQLSGSWHGEGACEAKLWIPQPGGLGAGQEFALYVDGVKQPEVSPGRDGTLLIPLAPGLHVWEWTGRLPIPGKPAICRAEVAAGSALLQWTAAAAAESYRIQVREAQADGSGREYICRAEGGETGRADPEVTDAAGWPDGCETKRRNAGGTDQFGAYEPHEESYSGSRLESFRLPEIEPGRRCLVRVQAYNLDQTGPWSTEYPLCGSAEPPPSPDGLRISRLESGFRLSWGQVAGAGRYRLYRRKLGQEETVSQWSWDSWGSRRRLVAVRSDSQNGGQGPQVSREPSSASGIGLPKEAIDVRSSRTAGASGESPELLYEGGQNEFVDCGTGAKEPDAVFGYWVTAVNGNGEGPASPVRDTRPGGMADWDPLPEEGFRRDPRNHEYGFSGFDPWREDTLVPLPPYPGKKE